MINIKKISSNQGIGWKRDFTRINLEKNKIELCKNEFAKDEKIFIGFSLCPHYTFQRLKRINTIFIKNRKYGHRNKNVNTFSIRKQISTRNAFNLEAVL